MVSPGNPQFGGALLVLGSTFGYRSFDYTWDGSLESISRGYTWTPGENISTCGGSVYNAESHNWDHLLDNCTCGFYAYSDGTDTHSGSTSVIDGVVEAYGRTVIGTRGIRSQKAKVVALCIPSDSRHVKIFRWYQRHSVGTTNRFPVRNIFVNGIIGGTAGLWAFIASFVLVSAAGSLLGALLLPVGVALLVNAFYGVLAEYHPYKPRVRYITEVEKGDLYGPMKRIKESYPDAKIYTSKSRMKKDFPIKNLEVQND